MTGLHWPIVGFLGLAILVQYGRAQQGQGRVTFATDLDCIWKLDGRAQPPLAVGERRDVTLSTGRHTVSATTADGYYVYGSTVQLVAGQETIKNIQLKVWHEYNRFKALGKVATDKAVADLAAHPTWTDPASGLMWTRTDNGEKLNWFQSVKYCKSLSLGGHSGWRLPEIEELDAIYGYPNPSLAWKRHKGEIVFIRGGLVLSGWEWSNTPAERPNEVHTTPSTSSI